MTLHRQVRIEVEGGFSFEVDEGISALVRALWQRGYRTTGSCEHQEGTPMAWIGFESKKQAETFAVCVDGVILDLERLEPEDFEGASPDDPARHGAAGVAFPANSIQYALARVEASRGLYEQEE